MRTQRILALLLVLMMAAAACSDDGDSDSSTEAVDLPDAAAVAVDDYYEAVAVEHDGQAMLEFVTDDFQSVSVDGVLSADEWADDVDALFDDFAVERLGDPAVLGGGSEYLVSQPEHITGTGVDDFVFSVMTVVDEDGTWLVGSHEYTSIAAAD